LRAADFPGLQRIGGHRDAGVPQGARRFVLAEAVLLAPVFELLDERQQLLRGHGAPAMMVKFPQRYQNSHRMVISGIVECPLDADALDSSLTRLFHRIQGELRIDSQALFALMAGDQLDLCIP
jgi:hypothetical protein